MQTFLQSLDAEIQIIVLYLYIYESLQIILRKNFNKNLEANKLVLLLLLVFKLFYN